MYALACKTDITVQYRVVVLVEHYRETLNQVTGSLDRQTVPLKMPKYHKRLAIRWDGLASQTS